MYAVVTVVQVGMSTAARDVVVLLRTGHLTPTKGVRLFSGEDVNLAREGSNRHRDHAARDRRSSMAYSGSSSNSHIAS